MGKVKGMIEDLVTFWKKYVTGSYDEAPNWLSRAKTMRASYLVTVWDSFEMEQFPVFIMPGDDPERIKRIYNQHPTTSVSKVMAVR